MKTTTMVNNTVSCDSAHNSERISEANASPSTKTPPGFSGSVDTIPEPMFGQLRKADMVLPDGRIDFGKISDEIVKSPCRVGPRNMPTLEEMAAAIKILSLTKPVASQLELPW